MIAASAPVVAQPMKGIIRLVTRHTPLSLRPLLAGGTPGTPIPITVKNGMAEIILEGSKSKTVVYEFSLH